MKFETPPGWRKGQTMFNFLEYLRRQGVPGNQSERLADSFHVSDKDWDKYWDKFIKMHKQTTPAAPKKK